MKNPVITKDEQSTSEIDYAVGVKSYFFHNEKEPFDKWGEKYKPAAYKALMQKIKEAGDVRTVHTNVYYPTERGEGYSQDLNILPAPMYEAKTGILATELDFYEGNKNLMSPYKKVIKRQSYKDTTIVDGKFPVIIMLHGGGGGHHTWNRAAEYMASQGYIAVTLTYISDSHFSPVFEDPKSNYAKTRTPEELLEDYKLVHAGLPTIFGGFFEYLYGEKVEFNPRDGSGFPYVRKLKAVKGGGLKATKMMAEIFEQRTEDLATVIKELKVLNTQDSFFKGKMDVDNIGLLGHSLGSITAQSALVNILEVKTAVASNNGTPKSWEPYGGFPNKSGNTIQPDGVPKDILFIMGSDDNFLHMVFKEIFYKWYKRTGGDITETMPLKGEQTWPTEDNPQPIALNSYERATANKMLLTFKDIGHGPACDEATFTPGEKLQGQRVPLDEKIESFMTPKFDVLGWVEKDGKQVFLPHQMRNYYLKAWFDWQLKGDSKQKERLINHPFGSSIKKMLHKGIED